MQIKILLFTFFLFLSLQELSAAQNPDTSFLLKADESTSLINFSVHTRAFDAFEAKEYENAFMIYLKIADKGDDRAAYNVAMMYMNGLGVEKDKKDALKWLRRAANDGNREALLYFKNLDASAQKSESKPQETSRRKYLPKETSQGSTLAIEEPTLEVKEDETINILYVLTTFVIFTFILGLFLLKKLSKVTKEERLPPDKLKDKSEKLKSAYANIAHYHTELLKLFNLERYKNDAKKIQIYYMFIAGAIDYFCQLEEFDESEKRRIFNTHMGNVEGKESVTSITQAILEGQRDHSFYHCQAAGAVSAKKWHETKSVSALLMLKELFKKEVL